MKLVQWPDNFPDMTDATPDLRALRRIGIALVAAAVITFGIAIALILHPPSGPSVVHPAKACLCKKPCCPRHH
jgi:hypothetical protein